MKKKLYTILKSSRILMLFFAKSELKLLRTMAFKMKVDTYEVRNYCIQWNIPQQLIIST